MWPLLNSNQEQGRIQQNQFMGGLKSGETHRIKHI